MKKFKLKIYFVFLLLAGTSVLGLFAQTEVGIVQEIDSMLKTYEVAQKYTLKEHEVILDVTLGRNLQEKVKIKFWFLRRDGREEAAYPAFLVKAMVTLRGTNVKRTTEFAWDPSYGLMWAQEDLKEYPCGLRTYYFRDGELLKVVHKGSGIANCHENKAIEDFISDKKTLKKFKSKSDQMQRMGQQYEGMFTSFLSLTY